MRLEDEEERAIAREAQHWELVAVEAVSQTAAAPLLDDGRNGRERTRGKDLDRLDTAVAALLEDTEGTARNETQRELAREAQEALEQGVALRWKLALSAIGVARQETRRMVRSDSAFDDTLQDAVLGLFVAARRFDPDNGASFGTYARWWVRASLGRSLSDSRMVRVPESAQRLLRVMATRRDECPDASLAELADEAGIAPERAARLLALQQPTSMDEPLPGTAGVTRGETLPDDTLRDPDDLMHEQHLWRRTLEAVEELDERSREVVVRRYGLHSDGSVDTLAAIAEDFGVTPQRIRQIQKRAEAQMAELAQEPV